MVINDVQTSVASGWLCNGGTEAALLQNLSGGTCTLPSTKLATGQQVLSTQALRKQLKLPHSAAQSQLGHATL